MEVSSLTAVGVLLGFAENAGFVSSPPDYYRTKVLSGSATGIFYVNSDCTGSSTNYFANIGGSIHYNDDGSVTNGATASGEGGGPPNVGFATSAAQALGLGSGWCVLSGCSGTIISAVEVDAKFTNPGGGTSGCGSGYLPGGGNAKDVLQDKDTEEDAIGRVVAVWSPYTTGIACAGIAPRTDRNVSYVRSKYRVNVQGDALFPVRVQVQLMRRPYGVGVYQQYSTQEYGVTLGFDGKGQIEDELPCDYGWQTCAVGCMVLPAF